MAARIPGTTPPRRNRPSEPEHFSRREMLEAGWSTAVLALVGSDLALFAQACGNQEGTGMQVTPPGTGTPADNSPFTVSTGGYVQTGPFAGYAWPWAFVAGTTISPTDFSGVSSGPLCVNGSVIGTTDYSAVAALGVNLAQPVTGGASGTVVPPGAGLLVNVSNAGGSGLRIQIQGADPNDPNQRWCAPLLAFDQVVFIPWGNFNTTCWTTGGAAYAMQPLSAILVLVPGSTETVPFAFCLNSLEVSLDGGTTGTGGASSYADETTYANYADTYADTYANYSDYSDYSDTYYNYSDYVYYYNAFVNSW